MNILNKFRSERRRKDITKAVQDHCKECKQCAKLILDEKNKTGRVTLKTLETVFKHTAKALKKQNNLK